MMTCRACGFTTGLMLSGNAFISIWPPTPASSPHLTQWHTWERNRATTRCPTCTTRAICATAFSVDTSTPRANTLRSSACAPALWVLTLHCTCGETFFTSFNPVPPRFPPFQWLPSMHTSMTLSWSEVCRSVRGASVAGLVSLRCRAAVHASYSAVRSSGCCGRLGLTWQ